MNKKLFWQGLGYAGLVAAYITLVAWGLTNGEKLFGGQQIGFWGPVMFLMLFCLSAAIVGALLFGRPIYLALTGDKKMAFWQAISNLGWLFALTLIVFSVFAIFSKIK